MLYESCHIPLELPGIGVQTIQSILLPLRLIERKIRRIIPYIIRESIKVMPVLSIKLTFAINIQPELAGREVLACRVQQHAAIDIGRCVAYSFRRLNILWNKFLSFAHM